MSELKDFLIALPKVLELLNRILKLAQNKELDSFLDNLEKAIDQIEKALTVEEKLEATRSLLNTIHKLH